MHNHRARAVMSCLQSVDYDEGNFACCEAESTREPTRASTHNAHLY
jgi:hypothetical protein